MSLIKRKKWNVCSGPGNFMNCYGFMIGFMKMRRYYDEYYDEIILTIKDEIVAQCNDAEQNFRNIKQLYGNPEKTLQDIKAWLKTKEEFYRRSELITGKLGKLSDKELMNAYKNFLDDMTETWALPLATDAMGLYTETELLKEFNDAVPKNMGNNVLEMFAILTQPTEISFIAREHISLLNLAILHKQKSRDFEKELRKHQKSYFWIENNYKDIEVLDEPYFLSKAEEEAKKDINDLGNEIKRITDTIKIRKKQAELLNKLNLPKNVEESILLTQKLGIWQDHRKEFNLISNHCLSLFLKEFSRRLNISLEDLYYLLPGEIMEIIHSDKIISKEVISERKDAFVHIVEQPQNEAIFQGRDALEIQNAMEDKTRPKESLKAIKGIVASKGKESIIKGEVKVVLDPSKSDFQKGEIIVASMTRPEYVPLMKKAKAIITDEGGITSHAAIVSRELGIPCIIGTRSATKILKNGDLIEINGEDGTIKILKKNRGQKMKNKLSRERPAQKQRIKQALKELQDSDKLKITVELDNKEFNIKPLPRIWFNKFVFYIQQWIVPCHLKNWLMRRTGMKVGHDACIPHYIKFDPYFPELIEIGPGTLIGGDSKLITHELEGKKLTLGKIIFPKDGMMGGMTTIHPGSKMEKNSILSFYSEFMGGVILEGEVWYGLPAKCIQKMDQNEIDKYFRHTGEKPDEYYRGFKKELGAFLKDTSKTYFKIQYGGSRAGAGNDWWKSRNVVRIFYNGPIIEITRMLPHCWLKILLLKMVGVKIGKNCKIGKGCVFDHIYCDNVTLGDKVIVGDNSYFDGHEYTIAQTVFGKTKIGNNTRIGHHSYVRPGAQVGENVIIEPNSFAQREIPSNEVWGGIPAKFIRKR